MTRARPWPLAVLVLALGGWEPLWRHDPDVESGNAAYAQKRYDDAVAAYDRARDSGVDTAGLAYDRGTALVGRAEGLPEGLARDAAYTEAMTELARAADSNDRKLRGKAHFNRGNVLMKQKKLEEAIAAYKDALRADATLDVARMNLELALRQRERERQQQQQGQGQGQQGQGQQGQGQQGQGQQGQGQQGQGQQGQGGDQRQQPQGQGDQQQDPAQGQGSGQGDPPPDPAQGQGSGQGDPQPGQGSGQGDPTNAQGGQGGRGADPTTPQLRWPTDDSEGETPGTPTPQKLDQLEQDSREQRREQIRRRTADIQLDSGEDW